MTEDTDNPWPAYRLADARRDAKHLIHITVGEGRDAKFYSFTHRRDAEWFLKGVTMVHHDPENPVKGNDRSTT